MIHSSISTTVNAACLFSCYRLHSIPEAFSFTLIWFMIWDCLINCLQFRLIPSHALAAFFVCDFGQRNKTMRRKNETRQKTNNPKPMDDFKLQHFHCYFTLRFQVQLNFKYLPSLPFLPPLTDFNWRLGPATIW